MNAECFLQVKFLKADIDSEALEKTVMDHGIASVVRGLLPLLAESLHMHAMQ